MHRVIVRAYVLSSVMIPANTCSINLYSVGVRFSHLVLPLSVDNCILRVFILVIGRGQALTISWLRYEGAVLAVLVVIVYLSWLVGVS